MFDISQRKLDHNCPSCSSKNSFTLKQVQNQETIRCTNCQKEVALIKDDSVDKAVQDTNKIMNDFKNSIKKLGR
jgi:transcription elongation factor Elf1